MATPAVFAEPSSPPLSSCAEPCTPPRCSGIAKSCGKASNSYKETRISNDESWKVGHTDEWNGARVILTTKGRKYTFNKGNASTAGLSGWKIEFWTCVGW
ncbi:MAG: hypothetical protein J3R72DRAFT_499079 [Linnemannia gamsii]|nr:MAG: hypothetical protein J3R72DRAFT_499079 [Linnemannia gamsii]